MPRDPATRAMAAVALLWVVSTARTGAQGSSVGAPPQLDGSSVNASTADFVQEHFMQAVKLADEIYDNTQDRNSSIAMLRAACQLCPACPLTRQGSWSWEVFYIDSYEDRTMLYSQIMPAIYSSNVKDLLWVGVQPYTLRYEYMLRRHGITMTSLEYDPEQAIYGSSHRHIVAPVQQLAQHVKDASFDAVIINGVIGWGVDSEKDVADTMSALYDVLRDQGLLVVGFNKPTGFHYWSQGLMPLFEEATLGDVPHEVDLETSEFHHVYEFFRRAPETRSHAHGFRHHHSQLATHIQAGPVGGGRTVASQRSTL